MKKRYHLVFSFLFLIYHLSFIVCIAQNSQIKRTAHWYFGGQAGLDFSSGTAVADTNGKLSSYAGCSSISDTLGNLLMYTNGQNVWNKNHQIMPNGTNLYGLGTPVQSSIIVPKPLDDNIYYIFTCAGYDGQPYGIRYSIVDLTLDGGLGDVTIKNELLFEPSSEQLGATMHNNCIDVWIMGHELNSNRYRAYLLTVNGIDTNNVVINDIGNFPQNDTSMVCLNCGGLGLKFLHNGKKMAACNFWDNWNTGIQDTLELFDFDNSTGKLSNRIVIPDTVIGAHFGFSPDDSKLYYNSGDYDSFTYQLDITSNNQTSILSTKYLIYYDEYWNQTDFLATTDNKLIIAVSSWDTLPVINNPNKNGFDCDFVVKGVPLLNRLCETRLPNFISSYLNQDSTSGCFYYVEVDEVGKPDIYIRTFPNPFYEYTTIRPLQKHHGLIFRP
jgi:hypothetical protein